MNTIPFLKASMKDTARELLYQSSGAPAKRPCPGVRQRACRARQWDAAQGCPRATADEQIVFRETVVIEDGRIWIGVLTGECERVVPRHPAG